LDPRSICFDITDRTSNPVVTKNKRNIRVQQIEAVIFDMGGTLIEFEHAPWNLTQIVEINEMYAFLARRNGDLPTLVAFRNAYKELWDQVRETSISSCRELDLGALLKEVCARTGIEADDELTQDLIRVHYAPVRRQLTMYPDVLETLETLRRRGYKLGLLSNTMWPRAFHEADLKKFDLDRCFAAMFFSSDFPCRKPHPAIFLATAQALGVSAEKTAYIGDYPERDIVGAKAAGMKAILKYHHRRTVPPSIVPDTTIRSVAELLNLLP